MATAEGNAGVEMRAVGHRSHEQCEGEDRERGGERRGGRERRRVRAALIASVVGNVLEWFDFGVFGFLSPQIGRLFFPPADRFVSTLNAYVVFGGGFIFRPLGGLILAHIGDVYGRKTALLMSVLGMAGATATMGCLPTYEDVGALAPVVLCALRLIQGLSVGGEFVGSMVFAVESMPPHRKNLGGAMCLGGAIAGLTLGAATGLMLHAALTPDQIMRFGWRYACRERVLVR